MAATTRTAYAGATSVRDVAVVAGRVAGDGLSLRPVHAVGRLAVERPRAAGAAPGR